MKAIILVVMTMAVTFGAMAQEYSSAQSEQSAYGREDSGRGPGRGPGRGGPGRGGGDDRGGDDRGGGRHRPDPGPASYCSAGPSFCGSSSGERGTIPGCSIRCYYGSVANCSEGSFSAINTCEVEEYNSCTCLGGY